MAWLMALESNGPVLLQMLIDGMPAMSKGRPSFAHCDTETGGDDSPYGTRVREVSPGYWPDHRSPGRGRDKDRQRRSPRSPRSLGRPRSTPSMAMDYLAQRLLWFAKHTTEEYTRQTV